MRILALLALLLAAGCITPSMETPSAVLDPATIWPAVQAAVAELPCDTDGSVGVLAADPLALDPGDGNGELALATSFDGTRTIAAVARYHRGGVDLVDVTDPLHPRQLSSWEPEKDGMRALDVKFSSDNATLVIGSDLSIRLLDVRDPSAPRLESELKLSRTQAHMVVVFPISKQDYVAALKGEGHDLEIFTLAGEPGARTLELASTLTLTHAGEPTGQDLLTSHDAWFTIDPLLQKPVLYVASSWDGVAVVDVSDPTRPAILGKIPNLDPYQGYTHTVQAFVRDGTRYVVAVQEVGANALKVWDATDFATPRLVAFWHVQNPTSMQHNLNLVGERAYVAHYGEGLFVFDLSKVGGMLPQRIEPAAHQASGEGGTWDVVVRDGVLYTSEIGEGLRVLGDGCLTPGDGAMSSTG
ncbi:MAG TPA: hypothetical protein VM370_04770 [Candidatus Thermoplasmatota archaeon]|nr:hypothetical protein [Candidatus Thermoplasmatota archaeon]